MAKKSDAPHRSLEGKGPARIEYLRVENYPGPTLCGVQEHHAVDGPSWPKR